MRTKRFKAPIGLKPLDADTRRVTQNIDERIRELQAVPILGGKLFKNVQMPDGEIVYISHGFGRVASCFVSPPRRTATMTLGLISDMRDLLDFDVSNSIALKAEDWTSTIVVDIWVF